MILDPHQYLPPTTKAWFDTFLLSIGFNIDNPPPHPPAERKRPWQLYYTRLRDAIVDHMLNAREPSLELCPEPAEGLNWRPGE